MNRITYLLPLLALGTMAMPMAAHAQGYGYSNYTSGQCREFDQTVMINGRPTAAYGTSCLQPDGSWQIVNSQTQGEDVQPAPYQTVTTQQYVQQQPVYVQQPVYYQPAPYYGDGYGYGGVPVSIGLGFGFGGHGGGDWGHGGGGRR